MGKYILLFFAFSSSVLADSPHCVSEQNSGKIVTQCEDGTVTVVGSGGEGVVCTKTSTGPHCEPFKAS